MWKLRLRPIQYCSGYYVEPCSAVPVVSALPALPTVVPKEVILWGDSRHCDSCDSCDSTVQVVLKEDPLALLRHALQNAAERAERADKAKAAWRRSLVPTALVTPESYTVCRISPVPPEQSLLSHVRLWENGTYLFTPESQGPSPTVFLGLQERPVGTLPHDLDLGQQGFDLTRPFAICETRQSYTITQDERSLRLSRSGLINGKPYVERQEVCMTISFADLSFHVLFAPPLAS